MQHLQPDLPDRLAGGVWGHLVGDAVGVPYEFRPAAQVASIEFGANGTHSQPAGTWSDDGALMLALLDSLLAKGFDTSDQGARGVAWWREKAYTPDGDGCFDIGNATSSALGRIEANVPAEEAGGTGERDNGNGSLMRILPVALTSRDLPDAQLVARAHRASRVTHGTPRALAACALYVLIAKRLLAGMGRQEALGQARASLRVMYETDTSAHDLIEALDFLEGYSGRAGLGRVWDSFWSAWDAFEGAQEGFRVLLTCFNRPLAEHLAAAVGRHPNLDVSTFHRLAEEWAQRAGIIGPTPVRDSPAYFDDLPDALDRALSLLPEPRYDAIVVDEAQDIDAEWWLPLLDLLADRRRGIVYVFGDANQDLYHARQPDELGVLMPDRPDPYYLTENRRSTVAIHEFAARFAPPLPDPDAPAPRALAVIPMEVVE